MLKVSQAIKIGFALVVLLLVSVLAQATTVKVHYNVGFGNKISIRGSRTPFNWTKGKDATYTTNNIWSYQWADSYGDMEIKPLINDAYWSTGGNYKIKAGTTVDIYPFFGTSKGTLTTVNNFYSPELGNTRTLIIYLPPSYNENSAKKYPVLYMHDGQNLFDPNTSFGGVEWGVDETIDGLVNNGSMDEVIVVGMYNTGANRIFEYTPCCDATYGGGGSDYYEQFIINTVKPYIDSHYRTLPSKENTALMGSSLGGLISFYIGYRHPEVFGKIGSLSGSFWWNNQALTQTVETSTAHPLLNVYIDAGTSNDGLTETTRMKNALVTDKFVQGKDLYFYSATGASHSEYYWAKRVNIPLTYMFPAGSTVQP